MPDNYHPNKKTINFATFSIIFFFGGVSWKLEECQFKLFGKHGNINIMRYKILVKTQSSRI